MKQVKAGIIGFGTVGSGVYNIIKQNGAVITERTGVSLEIAAICDLRLEALQTLDGVKVKTNDWKEIVNNPEIDVVIELIGGLQPAGDIILTSLQNGKSVVTANKKLLAEKGNAIFDAASKSAGTLHFEAAIGGGIPCILALNTGLAANRIRSIEGILNGTTNYILSQMEEKSISFDTALKEAQQKGFAEADPTFDIEGYDAGHKIALLALLAYGKRVDYTKIDIEGITKISDLDILYAKDMGYIIRLLGSAKMTDGALDISVRPTMIPMLHPLSSVRNELNAVMFDGDMTDPIILFGKGAGSLPTASAVLSDVIQSATANILKKINYAEAEEASFLPCEKRESKYYLRVYTKDEPGILSKITGILGRFSISIESLIQRASTDVFVPLIFLTHSVNEAAMIKAAAEINKSDFVKEDIVIIKVDA